MAGEHGKQFLGAIIECADGKAWIVDYNESSPYHAFADCRVIVEGRLGSLEGGSQRLIRWKGRSVGIDLGHLIVSTMRLVGEASREHQVLEIGPRLTLSGHLDLGTGAANEAKPPFITTAGATFKIFNKSEALIAGERPYFAYLLEVSVNGEISSEHSI
jgi:hypothetical protein